MSWRRLEARLLSRRPVALRQHVARFHCAGVFPPVQAGQFVQLCLPGSFWPRPFSLADWRVTPEGAEFSILFSEAGPGTRALASLPAGEFLEGHGPLGRGFPSVSGPTWMIAGGYGVAPLLFAAGAGARGATTPDEAAESATAADGATSAGRSVCAHHIRFFYGAASAPALWRPEELRRLDPTLCTEDGSEGFAGTVLEAARRALDDGVSERPALYACGPMGLLREVARMAVERDLPAHLSVETLMPCGIGVCRGCAVPRAASRVTPARHYDMACEDGPVFEARDIDWEAESACRT